MITEVKMFGCTCDNCNKDYEQHNDGYTVYGSPQTLLEYTDNDGWIEHNGKHYCDECWSYDENDNIILKKFTD